MSQNKTINRRQFLSAAAAVAAATIAPRHVTGGPSYTGADKAITTRQFLEGAALRREFVDHFINSKKIMRYPKSEGSKK